MVFLYLFFLGFAIMVVMKLNCVFSTERCRSNNRIEGKVNLVTGGNTGIGYEIAKDLARRGGTVILTGRNLQDAERAKTAIVTHTGNKNVYAKVLDLADFSSIRKLAGDLLQGEKKLDTLINNAGTLANGRVKTKDGLFWGLQVNYLGHFLLTILLLPLLRKSKSARIINASSMSAKYSQMDLEDISSCDNNLGYLGPYNKAKLLMIYFTWELAEKLRSSGITVNCYHPGFCGSNLYSNIEDRKLKNYCLIRNYFFAKTEEEGAQTPLHLAISDEVLDKSGIFFEECNSFTIEIEQDLAVMKNVWDQSVKLVGLTKEEVFL